VCWGDLGENAATSLTKGSRAIVTGRLEQRSWETNDGEKRSVVEVVADEVGPSLRWATAQIERTERTGGDGGFSGGGGGGGGYSGAGAGAGANAGGGAARQPDPIYGDEEPF
jgi:single-strand DNA-binding protein